MNSLTVKDVAHIAFVLAREMLTFHEPIPDFSTRYPHRLESCLATPFLGFEGKSLYPSLVEKASILFYLMIKNHPFQNGNKRIAMTTFFIFLNRNGKWLRVDRQKLYNFAKWVAASDPEVKNATVAAIEEFLRRYMVNG